MYQSFKKWGGGIILAMFGPLGVLTTILAHQDNLHGAFWWLIAGFSGLTAGGILWLIVAALSLHKTEQPEQPNNNGRSVLWPTWFWYATGLIVSVVFVLYCVAAMFLTGGYLQQSWWINFYLSIALFFIAVSYGPVFWLWEVHAAAKQYDWKLREGDLALRQADLQLRQAKLQAKTAKENAEEKPPN